MVNVTASVPQKARAPRPKRQTKGQSPAPGAAAGVAELTTEAQLTAFLHPVRRRVLAALVEPASPADVGRQLGIPAQVANYHVRALEAAGLAREVETRQ